MENYQTRVTPAKEDAVAALRDEFKDYNRLQRNDSSADHRHQKSSEEG